FSSGGSSEGLRLGYFRSEAARLVSRPAQTLSAFVQKLDGLTRPRSRRTILLHLPGYASLLAGSRVRLPAGPRFWSSMDKPAFPFSIPAPRCARLLPHSLRGQIVCCPPPSLLREHVRTRPSHRHADSGWPPFLRFPERDLQHQDAASSPPLRPSLRDGVAAADGSKSRRCQESASVVYETWRQSPWRLSADFCQRECRMARLSSARS